ncbi:MAG: hypothetical protein ACK5L6_10430 [Anaerorhabdus sp.]|uniref:hypothetical protein n=1 Tax=Anaerorhabdus sp. TaxID=1872524 RepID=UPI003A8B6E88
MKKLEKLKNEILNLCIIVAMITTMMPFYVVDTHGELLQPYTVYVNGSTGSDISGDGSFAKPYKSFEKSQQKAIDNKTVDQDILIKVTGGITVASNATWTGSTSYKTTLQRDSSFTGLLLSIAGSAGKLTVSNITFDGNNMNALGSLLMVNANGTASDKRLVLDVDNCEFINNRDTSLGGSGSGINIGGSYITVYINNSRISNNFANSNGGGIRFASSGASNVTIENTVISNNSTYLAGGGGIVSTPASGSILKLNSITLDGNTATGSGGGGIIIQTAQCDITDSTIINNKVVSGTQAGLILGGGGVKVMSTGTPVVSILRTLIKGNSVVSIVSDKVETGGGISLAGGTVTVTVTDSDITENTSNNDGGGISILLGTMTIESTRITNNSAKEYMGMTYAYNCRGGGIMAVGGSLFLSDNNIIQGNFTGSTIASDNIHVQSGSSVNVSGLNTITDNFYLPVNAFLTLTKGFNETTRNVFPIRAAATALGTVLVKPNVALDSAIPYQFNFSLQSTPYGIGVNSTNKTLVIATGYTISTSTDGNGIIFPGSDTHVSDGGFKSFQITPNFGYKIKDVVIDGVSVGGITEYLFTDVRGNHTMRATFELITIPEYKITASAGLHGSISLVGDVIITEGNNQVFAFVADSSYVIADVLVDGLSVGKSSDYEFIDIRENHTISVEFEEIGNFSSTPTPIPTTLPTEYLMIFATADEGCNIAPYGKVLVAYGSNQEFNIDAYSGYEIDYVLIDGVNVGAITDYLFTNVYENHTIHVSTKLTDEPILQENKIINNTTNKNELNSKNISAKKSSSIVYKIKNFVKQSEEKTWGLINLIITCLSALLSIILLLSKDSENKFKSKLIYKVLSILITIGLTIYFVSTQNMSYTMKLYDNFTGVMVLFISVNLLCVYFYRKHNQKTK